MSYRQIALDTETTGLSKAKGHRCIELGCVELDNYARTGETREWRFRVPMDTPMDKKALDIHGITLESLQGERTFEECAPEILEFLKGADLIGFHVGFDLGWLDHEFAKIDTSKYSTMVKFDVEKYCRKGNNRCDIDTRSMMKERFKDKKWSLDVLCKLLKVDTSSRTEHGALLDAQLTAECYIRMMKGGTGDLFKKEEWKMPEIRRLNRTDPTRDDYIGPLLVIRATPEEVQPHNEYMQFIAENVGKDVTKHKEKPGERETEKV